MSKYAQVFSIGWSSGFVYRLNFLMWRVRNVVQFLTIYLLWAAILRHNPSPAGYSASELLTYILLASLIRAVVFSSRSLEVQADIGQGNLNHYLIKPISYFGYWFSRDMADKLLNLGFAVVEFGLLFFFLKPPLVLPPSAFYAFAFGGALILATLLYFFFSLIVSATVFWIPEGSGWPQRFLIFVLMDFFAGGMFPLDMLPAPLYQFALKLPFAYMLSVPLQIYLGRLSLTATVAGLIIMFGWLFALMFLAHFAFRRGLRVYGAFGH
ncbi:hypothetical protein A2W24_03430 [Microgenomates group bacterium RBG_16_45_19]|nr:MAG: hypothetical protein A2W24_03430 [Microgenomates group bacterium RBG_16_45_19]